MRIKMTMDCVVINAKESEWSNSKTGQSGLSYKVSIDQDGEAGTLKCSKEVFETLSKVPRFRNATLELEYSDGKFESFSVVRVLGIDK